MSPWNEVLHKWKEGTLHSGSKGGPVVTDRKKAIAIMLSEKRKARKKPEYRASRLGNKSNPGTLGDFMPVQPLLIKHPGAMAKAKRQASAAHGAE